jgi:hypothetical protein
MAIPKNCPVGAQVFNDCELFLAKSTIPKEQQENESAGLLKHGAKVRIVVILESIKFTL